MQKLESLLTSESRNITLLYDGEERLDLPPALSGYVASAAVACGPSLTA